MENQDDCNEVLDPYAIQYTEPNFLEFRSVTE